MSKQIKVQTKEVASSGFGANNKSWTKYKITTEEGETFYMFDDLEVGREYEIESWKSQGKDKEGNPKEYTNWGLVRKRNKFISEGDEKLDKIIKMLEFLVRNHDAYIPAREKPKGELPL